MSPDPTAHGNAAVRDERSEWGRFTPDTPEHAALLALSDAFGTDIRPRQVKLDGGGRAEVEGVDADDSVVVQFVIKSGEFTSQHRNKVMADMFKLVWLRTALMSGARSILCVGPGAVPAFRRGTWLRTAADDLDIELRVWNGVRAEALETPEPDGA